MNRHIDYKKPIPPGQDMRTSTYLGHKYLDDTVLGSKINAKITEIKQYNHDPVLERLRTSDYKANYVWQFDDPDELRNPTLSSRALYVKPFAECKLHFIKRPLKPPKSVSHEDFQTKIPVPAEKIHPMQFPPPIPNEKIVIDYSRPGRCKYLDPSATTNRLDYVGYTPSQLMKSVAAHDNITFWNWKTIKPKSIKVTSSSDDQICDETRTERCPKRRCEFPSLVKHVPYAGLTTEVRDNYINPEKRDMEMPKMTCTVEKLHLPVQPSQKHTEAKLYGSGEPTHTYI